MIGKIQNLQNAILLNPLINSSLIKQFCYVDVMFVEKDNQEYQCFSYFSNKIRYEQQPNSKIFYSH